jgi:hypothetical protein
MKRTAPSAMLALLGVLLVASVTFSDSSGPGGRFHQRLRLLEERLQGPSKPAPKPRARAVPARKIPQAKPAHAIVSKRVEHPRAVVNKRIVSKRVERRHVIVSKRVEPTRTPLSRQTRPVVRVLVGRRPEKKTEPRAVATGRQVSVPAPIRENKGPLSVRVSYSISPRSARAAGPKETGDLILLAEPRKARVFFYVKGGSQLPGITAASIKACEPQKMHVVVYAPELRGRSQAFVPVQPNRVTTVRFVFPDPQKKFGGKQGTKPGRPVTTSRAAGAPAVAADPASGPEPTAFAPPRARGSTVPTAP